MKKYHIEILPDQQRHLFDILAETNWISCFYMAGGTALGLHIGHRQSIDFDFFSKEKFKINTIIQNLKKLGSFEIFDKSDNTINGALNNIKISFFIYEYPLLKELHKYKEINIADIFDISLMKLAAIEGRGSRKDFIDLYFILQFYSITDLFDSYPRKFGDEVINHYHLLKSLVYFIDAEKQPMPIMLKKVNWEEVKESIINKIKKDNKIKFF